MIEVQRESFVIQFGRGLVCAFYFNVVLVGLLCLSLLTQRPLFYASMLAGFLVGGASGSFLNCTYYRLRTGLPLLGPANHCPNCLTDIRTIHSLPLLGWCLARGKCGNCGLRIPMRYLTSELLGGCLGMIATARCGIFLKHLLV